MEVNHHPNNNRPAPDTQGISPKSHMDLRVMITTDGTWFTVHGDKNDNAGFALHLSTDGSNAELTILACEAEPLPPALQLNRRRPA